MHNDFVPCEKVVVLIRNLCKGVLLLHRQKSPCFVVVTSHVE